MLSLVQNDFKLDEWLRVGDVLSPACLVPTLLGITEGMNSPTSLGRLMEGAMCCELSRSQELALKVYSFGMYYGYPNRVR